MQDVEQMLQAQNEYRRRRGEREISEEEFREDVARDEIEHLSDAQRSSDPERGA